MPKLTKSQRRALLFLPADGSWSGKLGLSTNSVISLASLHPDLAEIEWRFDPAYGNYRVARLTLEGQAERARREPVAARATAAEEGT